MKKVILLLLILFPVVDFHAKESEIVLKTAKGDIKATLLQPENDSKQVVVLFINGSGPTDRNGNNPQMRNNATKFLAEDLMAADIASVRYDKRGIAKSANVMVAEKDLRISTYAEDAKEWINRLAEEYKQVVVIGHSEGSLIGIMAAANNPQVAALVSIAGAGRTADQILKTQLETTPEHIRRGAYTIIDSLKAGKETAKVPPAIVGLFKPSVQPYLISWIKVDPVAEIAKLTVPVLVMHGDKDIQISTKEADMLIAACKLPTKAIIPNMNHVLKSCTSTAATSQIATYNNPSLKNNPKVAENIIAFIKKATQ